ncbi:hypothetical protein BDY24DRAFT_272921 [Mrakia frigida]|uniref:uncharacterized protein n=1 Tax=Mrakia frigida TaxID=29902 RepID=UPI003FCBF2EC
MIAPPPPPPPRPPSSDFDSLVFYVVEESLAGLAADREIISDSLLSKGAQLCPPPPPLAALDQGGGWKPRFDLDKVTLVVSDSINFAEYDEIEKRNKGKGTGDKERKWVVTTRWMERMERCDKWLHPQFFSPDPKLYFSGVCVCVSDEMSTGDRDAINSAVSAFGGSTKMHLTTEVSHLLCQNTKGSMYSTGIDNIGPGLQVLLPHWVDDCFTKGVRVREEPYSWPDPPILQGDPQKIPSDVLPAQRNLLKHDLYADPSKPAPHPNYDTSETLKGKKIFFSSSLEMERMRLEGIKGMVRRAGGEVLEGNERRMVGKCDVLITKYRSGSSYKAAVRGDKTIATVAWLYEVCLTKKWVDSKAHLLHYPIPDDTIPEFAQFNMTVTNYTGDSREYIKKLIDLMGGRFTADMGKKNTHVIAANDQGAKVAKARSWSLTLVNHHWLEACFVRWAVVNPTTDALFSIHSHGISAQPIIALKGLVDADLARWTEPALTEEHVEEEEEDEEMEIEDGLVVPSGASGRDRGDVEVELAEEEGDEEEDDDEEMLPETADIGKGKGKGKGKERVKVVEEKEDVEMEDQEQSKKKKKKSFASQSKSTPDLFNPTGSSLAAPLLATRATSDVFGILGASEIPSSKAPTASAVKGHSSRTLTSQKPSSSPRRAAATREDSSDSSSTPDEDDDEEESDDDDEEEQQPPPAPRPKPVPTNAHASTSNSKPTSSKPTSKKPTSITSSTTNAVASGSGSGSGSNHTPRAGSTRGVSPSSILPPRSRRKAADNAERLLHETIMPDVLLYEKAKRNGTLMSEPRRRRSGGGDESGSERGRSSSSPGKKSKRRRKTSVKEEEEEEEEGESSADEEMGKGTAKGKGKSTRVKTEEEEEEEERAGPSTSRKAGKGKPRAPAVKVLAKVLTTKITLTQEEIDFLAALGAKVVSDAAECTHLVTSEISRTEKFLQALAVVPAIVNQKWVTDSIKAGKLLDAEPPYLLSDPANEKKLKMTLPVVLQRAAVHRPKGGLLAGKTFWVTRSVETSFDVMKRLIESAGGEIVKAIPRASTFIDSPDTKFLISCLKDKAQWKPLAEKGVTVYDRELVLTGLVQQQLEFKKFIVNP